MDLGFRGGFGVFGRRYAKLPFDVVWANDANAAACRTYRRNLRLAIRQDDVWNVLDTLPSSCDVLFGGFPCQDISINGKGAGVDGPRSGLYRAMVAATARLRPKVLVAENVKGLLMRTRSNSLRQVVDDFSALGYTVTHSLYHASDYGVPQNRHRVFIVGTAPGVAPFNRPEPLAMFADRPMTAAEAIGDLECQPENPETNHVWSRAKRRADQGGRQLRSCRPAQTIRAECHGNIQFHYALDRRLSMREAARLQSFPDDFVFMSGLRETERQVGNAVPPVLAWHIARSVDGCLRDRVAIRTRSGRMAA